MKNKQIKAIFDIQTDSGDKIATSMSSDYYECNVRFSLSRCIIKKDVCLTNVTTDKTLLENLYKTLGKFENYTWRQMQSLSRENGISIEKKNQEMHKILQLEMLEANTFGHFRVNHPEKSTFRVFGGIMKDLFYILYFDVDGKMQH